MKQRYTIPAETVVVEQEIKKSRFITTIGHADSKPAALSFIQNVKDKYADARHNCWAYVAGNPYGTPPVGMSDDGEPQGTAGKPLLNVLNMKEIGNIVVVVTRYFGGIKLGKGGLARAYSGSLIQGLNELKTILLIPMEPLKIEISFKMENSVRHSLGKLKIPILNVHYISSVIIEVEIPEGETNKIKEEITQICSGKVKFFASE
jgi:uncharacterized YigZ family protein